MHKVTDEERAGIARLHGEGKGRNEIARMVGRAQRTVSIVCGEEGLVFDVTMTEEATRHRVAQLADRRAMLAEGSPRDGRARRGRHRRRDDHSRRAGWQGRGLPHPYAEALREIADAIERVSLDDDEDGWMMPLPVWASPGRPSTRLCEPTWPTGRPGSPRTEPRPARLR
ncbi:helix-turn-helix domain-containing protein [Streptomyces sp. NPDC050732]|uniref:helix-turn-helix domain-containing protein n=1 Tax=Streptomyces sp. NPDC050732 TaxID=3154632 RepID=UPI00341A8C19